MKKNLIVKQDGEKDCGAACLVSIVRYYGGNISINRMVELTHTTKDGTSFYDLKEAALEVGLEAQGYKFDDMMQLREVKTPFICQFIDSNSLHFVVVYQVNKENFIIMDPAIGKKCISFTSFSAICSGYVLVFSQYRKLDFFKEEKFLNHIIIETIQKNKGIIFNILLLSIIFTVTSCLYAMYFQGIVDYVLDSDLDNLVIVTFFFGILLFIKCFSSFFRNELLIVLNQKLDLSMFLNTYRKLLLLPYNYYKNKTTGEMISRINDLVYVKNMLSKVILTVFLDFILVISSGIILFLINKIMFLILIVIMIIYGIIFLIFRPELKRTTDDNQKQTALIHSFLIESIGGFETIKNLGLDGIMKERMDRKYVQYLNHSFYYDNISNLELFIKDIVCLIGLLLANFIGFLFVMNGSLSIGTIITFQFLASFFIDPVCNIIDLNKEYFYAMNSLKRVNHLFDVEQMEEKETNFEILGDITVHDLSFGYRDYQLILENINFSIRCSEKVVILGNSGNGKSTLLKLILKYYKVNQDTIYFGDIDLNEYSFRNIHKYISCISQNELLFTDTIRNNICFYRNIDEDKFRKVCHLTCVDEFVKDLFLGYDTKLEENGLNLSGGQRQRIILARMLLSSSNIYLIDEGLNEVDVSLERKILKNIFEFFRDKTFVIISHRLENLDLFDKVLKLEGKHIQEVCS